MPVISQAFAGSKRMRVGPSIPMRSIDWLNLKIVERAKGVMQRDLKISEEEAYLTLQRESRQRRKSMREVAETILLNDEIRTRRE
jgi:hypothetical protein